MLKMMMDQYIGYSTSLRRETLDLIQLYLVGVHVAFDDYSLIFII